MGLFSSRKQALGPPSFQPGRLGYAVGDIHGRADLLARMFDRLEEEFRAIDPEPPLIVFLGDYIDRGPDSRAVIDLLLSDRLGGFERRFLMGNHEASMLAFLRDPVAGKAWLRHGGLETLSSYDVRPLPSLGAGNDDIRRAGERLNENLPTAHRRFLEALERYIVVGDYCFVHAGVDTAKKLEAQTDADLLWIRHKFLNDTRPAAHVIVHGHTPVDAPHRDARRIGVDTGAYFSGVLTAARFYGVEVEFVQAR